MMTLCACTPSYPFPPPPHPSGPAATITGRPKDLQPECLPGPADYQQLAKAGQDMPAFTMYGRWVGGWGWVCGGKVVFVSVDD